MILDVLDNILQPSVYTDIETDKVGFNIVASFENYGSYLLDELCQSDSMDLNVIKENLGT